MKEYIANLSGGKDSIATVEGLIEENYPLTKVVTYDTGMEFQAIYRNIEKISEKVTAYGAQMVYLKSDTDFLTDRNIQLILVKRMINFLNSIFQMLI